MNSTTIYDDAYLAFEGYYKVASKIEVMFKVIGSLSAICSFSVVLTPLLFPTMMRRKIFMQIIFFCSLSDCIASIMMAFGFPPNGNLCVAQGSLTYFFYKASWIWVSVLTLQLYCLVVYGKLQLNIYHLHIIAWGVSLILTCIPLSTNGYGVDDGAQGYLPCNITDGTNALMEEKWTIATFFAPLIMCLFIMSFFSVRVWLWHRAQAKQEARISATIRILSLYPISMFVFWVPNVILSLMQNFKYKLDTTGIIAGYALVAWGGAYGIMLAIVFFTQSQEVSIYFY